MKMILAAKTINFCSDPNVLKTFRICGTIINIIKVLAPVVIIIMGIIKLSQVTLAGKDTSEALKDVMQRVFIGIFIFFVPTLVGAFMKNVNGYTKSKSSFSDCGVCFTSAGSDACKKDIAIAVAKKDSELRQKIEDDQDRMREILKKEKKKKEIDSLNRKTIPNSNHPSNLQYPAAEASLMMALSSPQAATANYGSDLYTYIYDHVLVDESAYRKGLKQEAPNGSTRYRSCSEAVAVAVRWSGTDDSFPKGGPHEQLVYMQNSSKWVRVNWNGDFSKLQPGDVFIDNAHSLMYVGTSLLHKYFPQAPANYNITQASYNVDYIHQARSLSVDYRADLTSARWINNAYRCVQRETNSKFANLNAR